ncbi:MAG: regulatory protein RecX [Chloroflexi bacterium]|nr:MAG: regulatory protein RecX [Chloroflexota bacterium]
MRLLAIRPHSTAELRRKLARRGLAADDVQAALARLRERGYLDDAAYARALVRRRAESRGARAIGAELFAKGIGREVAGVALAGLDREAELEAAERLVRRFGRGLAGNELLQSVGPKLLRRGFAPNLVREACRRATASQP